MRTTRAAWVAVAIVALSMASCGNFDKWECPTLEVAGTGSGSCDCQSTAPPADTTVADNGGTSTRACGGCLAGLAGTTLRFNSITVTEPSDPPGLPGYLNGIWQEDMCRHILNIMLRIDTIDPGTGIIEFTAGPAWHNRDPEEQATNANGLPMAPGCLDGTNPVSNPPTEYYFLPGYSTTLTAKLRDDSCTFDTITPVFDARLRFHAGTPEKYFTCSPENSNEIPIEKLAATGRISDDCTMILDADLTGCIAHSAACEICAWAIAPDYSAWAVAPDANVDPIACDLSYCKHHCSAMWPNFGALVSGIFGVPRNCDLDGNECPEGDDTCREEGYGIAGFWTATKVQLKPE